MPYRLRWMVRMGGSCSMSSRFRAGLRTNGSGLGGGESTSKSSAWARAAAGLEGEACLRGEGLAVWRRTHRASSERTTHEKNNFGNGGMLKHTEHTHNAYRPNTQNTQETR